MIVSDKLKFVLKRQRDDHILFRKEVEKIFGKDYHRLTKPNSFYSALLVLLDISIIVAGYALIFVDIVSPVIQIIVVSILIGNRQRALMNLLHESSHSNLFNSKSLSKIVIKHFIAPLLFVDIDTYKKSHIAHHKNAGIEGLDGNLMHTPQKEKSLKSVFFKLLFDKKIFPFILLGYAINCPMAGKIKMFLWWSVFGIFLSSLFGVKFFGIFILMWYFARIFVYHPLTVFREILDHIGLLPGTISEYTRNIISNSYTKMFFHPHNNGYHLLHHYVQEIPYHNLPKAHNMLIKKSEYYRNMIHLNSYFFGQNSAIAHFKND